MASELKVDKFTGVTTAGSILVTGEGNSTTTNLQQGLCKAWYDLDETGTAAIDDNFNCASVTDNGTGAFNIAWTNSMSNTTYASLFGGVSQSDIGVTAVATGSHTILTRQGFDGTSIDLDPVYSGIFGDLA